MKLRHLVTGLGAAALICAPISFSAAIAGDLPGPDVPSQETAGMAAGGGQGIVGGRDATEVYPWNATWGQYFHECGGALIAPQWVVTAKHCTLASRLDRTTIRLGSPDWDGGGEQVQGDRWVKHPDLDIALLHLTKPAQSPVVPVATVPSEGAQVRLLGWGWTDGTAKTDPDTLQEIDVKVVPAEQCAGGDLKPGKEFCVATDDGGSGACGGDSGGPALLQTGNGWALLGATSRGPSACADGGTIYTSLTGSAAWINENTGLNIPTQGQDEPGDGADDGPQDPPAPADDVLVPGTPKTGLGGAVGEFTYFTVSPQAGVSSLTVSTSGGTGDVDLYVKAGSDPTATSFDCRPYRSGNAESCTVKVVPGANYHVGLRGYSAYSGVTLTVATA